MATDSWGYLSVGPLSPQATLPVTPPCLLHSFQFSTIVNKYNLNTLFKCGFQMLHPRGDSLGEPCCPSVACGLLVPASGQPVRIAASLDPHPTLPRSGLGFSKVHE